MNNNENSNIACKKPIYLGQVLLEKFFLINLAQVENNEEMDIYDAEFQETNSIEHYRYSIAMLW